MVLPIYPKVDLDNNCLSLTLFISRVERQNRTSKHKQLKLDSNGEICPMLKKCWAILKFALQNLLGNRNAFVILLCLRLRILNIFVSFTSLQTKKDETQSSWFPLQWRHILWSKFKLS